MDLRHLIKRAGYRMVYALCRLVPVDSKKALFQSFLGKSYSDNPRAISERLHELRPDWRIVWVFRDPEAKRAVVPDYVTCVPCRSLSYLFHRATSGVWVENYCIADTPPKRRGQRYIQTWHGDRGNKRILAAMHESEPDYRLWDADQIDLAVAGSAFGVQLYRTAFRYAGRVLDVGCPRNDVLVTGDETRAETLRAAYGVPAGKKLLLFAPTFRDSGPADRQEIRGLPAQRVLSALSESLGGDWMMMVRGHTGRRLEIEGVSPDAVIDVTGWEDTKDVLLAADAVITDYSSLAFDFALTGRPVFFFVPDLREFQRNDRALWFRFEDTPFWFADSEAGLLALIRACTPERAAENCKALLDYYDTNETGRATDAVCDYILHPDPDGADAPKEK